jgi:hypothetical protein
MARAREMRDAFVVRSTDPTDPNIRSAYPARSRPKVRLMMLAQSVIRVSVRAALRA